MDDTACFLDVLADELVLSVLRWLDRVGDLARLSATCRRMHGLASDDILWRSIFVRLVRQPSSDMRFSDSKKGWRWLCRAHCFLATAPDDDDNDVVGTAIGCLARGCVVYRGDICGAAMAWHGYGHAHWVWQQHEDVADVLARLPYLGPRPHAAFFYTVGLDAFDRTMRATSMALARKAPTHPVARAATRGQCPAPSIIRTHQGEWVHGMSQGPGICTWTCGTSYEGHFERDLPHGQGDCVWSDGACYRGAWIAGEMDGSGVMTTRGGDRYEGGWHQGKRHGNGTYLWADGSSYSGEWADNQKHGHGTMTYSNGETHVGSWASNRAHGQGTRTRLDGRRYCGGWANGRPDGDGVATHADGDAYRGVWRQGRLCGVVFGGNAHYCAAVHRRADGSEHLCRQVGVEWHCIVVGEAHTPDMCTVATKARCIVDVTLARALW
ncbi:Morn repeat domain containing protein [Pandoravirus salinus]|uniref:Morn repeat domain containing protein n=1 Tax=Pandoravirus salinus TaxID=1349410 RepID=S4VVN1_9VIRU|nr:morn repeat domain [Pandoravirus salinus]AGO84699.1 Morn repeat domain containing protein [Pandoravirus salinus]